MIHRQRARPFRFLLRPGHGVLAVRRALREGALGLHRVALRSGAISGGLGRILFEIAYDLYKARVEAGEIAGLRAYVRRDACVVDVGANIGFFTLRFARWLTGRGRVLAIEPETVNLGRLRARIRRAGIEARVEIVHAAAVEREGEVLLAVNAEHPGDHRLSRTGIPVPAVSVDGLLAARGWPAVSLLKIDVQGAEERVIAGARETLERFSPAVWMEVDPVALGGLGTTARSLLRVMEEAGYRPHRLTRRGVEPALAAEEACALAGAAGYTDFLFLKEAG